MADQVSLLEENPHQYVARRSDREYQMAHTHLWSCPEGNRKAQHDGMAHMFVESGFDEARSGMLGSSQVTGHLMQSEQIEMTDHGGR